MEDKKDWAVIAGVIAFALIPPVVCFLTGNWWWLLLYLLPIAPQIAAAL